MYVNTTACHAAVQKDTQCTHHGDTGDNTQSTHTGHSRRIGLAYPDEYTLRVLTDTAPTTAHWVAKPDNDPKTKVRSEYTHGPRVNPKHRHGTSVKTALTRTPRYQQNRTYIPPLC